MAGQLLSYLAALLTVAGFMASGHLLIRVLRINVGLGVLGGGAVRCLVGASSLSMVVFLVSLTLPARGLNAGWSLAMLSLPVATVDIAWSAYRGAAWSAFRRMSIRSLATLFAAVLAVEAALLSGMAIASGLGWDGLAVWAIKARMIFVSGGVRSGLLTDPSLIWTHPTYPLLLPIDEALLYRTIGAVDERAVKVLFAVFAVCLLAVFYSLLRRQFDRGWACLYSLILIGLPGVFTNVITGSADGPLATFLLAGGGLLFFWFQRGNRSDLVLAGLLLASAAWLKQEGWLIWGVGFLMVAGRHVSQKKGWRVDWRAIATFAAPILLVVPWYIRIHELSVSEPDFAPLASGWLLGHLDRVPFLIGALIGQLFRGPSDALWLMLAVGLVIGHRSRGAFFLGAAVAVHLFAITAAYVFSTWVPYQDHVYFSMDRVILQVVPLAALLLAVTVREPHLKQVADWLASIRGRGRLHADFGFGRVVQPRLRGSDAAPGLGGFGIE